MKSKHQRLSFHGSRSPGHTSRVSDTPFPGGSPFCGSRYLVHTSCVSDTPFPGWGFRRLRAAGERRSRAGPKRVDNLRFSTLLGSSPFPFLGIPRRDGTQAFLLRGVTEKKNGYRLPFFALSRRGRGRLHGFCVVVRAELCLFRPAVSVNLSPISYLLSKYSLLSLHSPLFTLHSD